MFRVTTALGLFACLVVVMAGCGGGEDSNSDTASTTTAQDQGDEIVATQDGNGENAQGEGSGEGGGNGSGGSGGSGGDAKSSGGSGEGGGSGGSGDGGGSGSGNFAPKQHDDSGGGSQQFRVKGGDNSVQEYGAEASSSEFEKAAAVLHNFLDARAEKNWAAACVYMSKDMVSSLIGLSKQSGQIKDVSCAAALEALSGGVPTAELVRAAKADVGSVRIEGERAFIIYRGAEKVIFAMPMKDEDGEWKVASLAGTPLT